jgi:hypothetical protein
MGMGMTVVVPLRAMAVVQALEGGGHHGRVQVAALAGVDLDGGGSGGADAVGVEAGLLVAFDHRGGQLWVAGAQRLDGGAQQRGLARAGAADQVERGHAVGGKVLAVAGGHAVVGAEDVGLDLHGARLAEAWHRHLGFAHAEVQVLRRRGAHAGADGPGGRRGWVGGGFEGGAVPTASTHDTHDGFPS